MRRPRGQDGVGSIVVHDFEGFVEVVRLANAKGLHRDADRLRDLRLRLVSQRHAKVVLVPKHRHALEPGQQFLEQPKPLGAERRRLVGDAGEVAARPSQTLHKARRDGITNPECNDRWYAGRFRGVVFSNEFFDALPVNAVAYRDGCLRELFVGWDGRFIWVTGPPARAS